MSQQNQFYLFYQLIIHLKTKTGTSSAKKSILITIVLTLLYVLNGNFVLMNYVTTIFKEAGSTLTPIHSSIVAASVQLFANFLAVILSDRFGRKILLSVSAYGSALGLVSTGLYVLFANQLALYKWIPIVSFSMTILVQSVGLVSLYMIITNEILPKKVIL